MINLSKDEILIARKALKTYQTFYVSPSNPNHEVLNRLLDKLTLSKSLA